MIHTVVTILVIFFSVRTDPYTSLVGAFFTGIIFDVWFGRPIGFTAAQLVIVSFLLNLYKRKFNAGHGAFLFPFIVGMSILVQSVTPEGSMKVPDIVLVIWTSLGFSSIVWVILRLWRRIFGKDNQLV